MPGLLDSPSCVSMSSRRSLSGAGAGAGAGGGGGSSCVTWFMVVWRGGLCGAPPPAPPPAALLDLLLDLSRLPGQPFLPLAGILSACLLAMRPIAAAYLHPRLQGYLHHRAHAASPLTRTVTVTRGRHRHRHPGPGTSTRHQGPWHQPSAAQLRPSMIPVAGQGGQERHGAAPGTRHQRRGAGSQRE